MCLELCLSRAGSLEKLWFCSLEGGSRDPVPLAEKSVFGKSTLRRNIPRSKCMLLEIHHGAGLNRMCRLTSP